MKGLTKAEQLNSALKTELKKPKLSTIRRVYFEQKMELLEEFMNYQSKQKN